jgi:hypothetical protein
MVLNIMNWDCIYRQFPLNKLTIWYAFVTVKLAMSVTLLGPPFL